MKEKAEAGLVWTPDQLDAFLADPRGFLKGTRMAYGGMKDADQRAALIAYLSTFSED